MTLTTKIYFEIPKRCKQCAWPKECAWLDAYFNGKGSAEEFAINGCAGFKWNDQLTGYDFEEDA